MTTTTQDLRHNAEFGKLLLAQAVSWFGSSATTLALVFALLDSRHGVSGAGLVLAARALPSVVLGLVGGVVADRFKKKTVVIAAATVVGVVQIALAASLWVIDVPLSWLLAAVVTVGSVQALAASSAFTLLPEIVDDEHLQQAQAVLRLARNGVTIVGPALGGLVVYSAGPHVVVLADGCAALVAASLYARLHVTSLVSARPSIIRDLREGWSEVRGRGWLLAAVPAFSVALLAWAGGFAILAPMALLETGRDARTWGLIGAALSVGYVVGSLAAVRYRPRNRIRASLLCQSATCLPLVAIAFDTHLTVILAAAFVGGVAMDLAGVLWVAGLQLAVPREVLGRVSSYDYVGSFGLVPLGYLLAHPASEALGLHGALLGFASLILLAPLSGALSRGVARGVPDHRTGERARESAAEA